MTDVMDRVTVPEPRSDYHEDGDIQGCSNPGCQEYAEAWRRWNEGVVGNLLWLPSAETILAVATGEVANRMDGYIAELRDDNAQLRDQLRSAERTERDLRIELANKDEWFIQKTWEHSEGCDEGKQRFLEWCGLDSTPPSITGYVELRVQVDLPRGYNLRSISNELSSVFGEYDTNDDWSVEGVSVQNYWSD